MKKSLVITLFFFVYTSVIAQSRLSLFNSNYTGVYGLHSNPSSIADSRHTLSVNILMGDVYVNNTYARYAAPFSPWSYLRDRVPDHYRDSTGNVVFSESYLRTNRNSRTKKFAFGSDIMGPSLMLRLSPRQSIAFGTRTRSQLYINNVSNDMLSVLAEGFNDTTLRKLLDRDNKINVNLNAYMEWNASYARVLYKNKEHFLKGGLTFKRVYGIYSAHVLNHGIKYHLTQVSDPSDTSRKRDIVNVDDIDIELGLSRDGDFNTISVSDIFNRPAGKGWGFDIGFTYEYRPGYNKYYYPMDGNVYLDNSRNKYKYKIGIALVDIGSVDYSAEGVNKYKVQYDTVKVTPEQYKALEDRDQAVDTLISIFKNKGLTQSYSFRSGLPTALHIQGDYLWKEHFYIGGVWVQDLRGKNAIATHATSMFSVVPRAEWAKAEISMPVSWINYHRLALGAQLRLGPVLIGSDNLAAALNIGQPSGLDVYAGLSINLLKKKRRDKDKDGISDRLDKCDALPGTLACEGCPDRDQDGIVDKEDACPGTPGLKIFQGCPDTDGDGMPDIKDACPDEYGEFRFTGCPDKDHDLVMDKIDECPSDSGSILLNGCPEIAEIKREEQDTLSTVIERIPDRSAFDIQQLFVPLELEKDTLLEGKQIESLDIQLYDLQFESGKTVLTDASYEVIEKLAAYLLMNPSYQLLISGHTDNVGSKQSNKELSRLRAAEVKKALAIKGVAADRLFTRGYGAEKPVASNKTEKGRTKNRRVELTIIK